MLESFRRLFAARAETRDRPALAGWAERRGLVFKKARGDDGFVVEGAAAGGRTWRLEWGPPQRNYLEGRELRLRMELGRASEAQMLVLSRRLMETLERRTFEEFTDTLQTQVGTGTPEEMRWLVMFPKVDLSDFGALKTRFGAVASNPAVARAWLDGPLHPLLARAAAPDGLLRDDPPFLMMTLRGKAYLRLQTLAPTADDLDAALRLFETAVDRAIAVGAKPASSGPATRAGGYDDTRS